MADNVADDDSMTTLKIPSVRQTIDPDDPQVGASIKPVTTTENSVKHVARNSDSRNQTPFHTRRFQKLLSLVGNRATNINFSDNACDAGDNFNACCGYRRKSPYLCNLMNNMNCKIVVTSSNGKDFHRTGGVQFRSFTIRSVLNASSST